MTFNVTSGDVFYLTDNIKSMGVDASIIARATGLSMEEIKKL